MVKYLFLARERFPSRNSCLTGSDGILFSDQLKGASEVSKPKNSGVANAIGSAISQVSGQVEKIFIVDELGREQTLEFAKQLAFQQAIDEGADPEQLVLIDLEEVPLSYLPRNATKIRAKAADRLLSEREGIQS